MKIGNAFVGKSMPFMSVLLCMFSSVVLARECTWTGGAGNDAWTDGGNWDVGVKPQAGDTVNLAGGVVFADISDFACSSVGLSGGELVLSVAHGNTANLSVPVTGSGTVCKAGEGVLRLQSGMLASGVSLCVNDGMLDLNGLSQAFATVIGGGAITNSTLTEAVLTVSNSQSASLTAKVSGLVKVVKEGDGTLSIGGCQTYSGDTLVNGGTICAITNVAVESVEGCVVHLDASRPDTMVLDSNNHVVSWRSTAGDGLVFMRPNASQPTPVYVSDGAGAGLPAVRFGFTDATGTTKTSTYLLAGQTVKHKTVIFVTMPTTGDSDSYYTPYGDVNSADNRICFKAYYLTSTGAFYGMVGKNWGELGGETGTTDGRTWQYVNGECLMTTQSEYKAYFKFDADGVSRPHVLTVVQAEGKSDILIVPSVGRAGGLNFYGSLCEVVVFDRTLSDTERLRIETALIRKWQLTHMGDATFENPFSPSSSVVVSGNNSVDFGGMDVKLGGLSVKDGCSYVFDVPSGQVQSADFGVVSGPGTLEKRGEGTLKLKTRDDASRASVELHVDDGILDLDGGFLSASKVLGGGVVTNTAATVATFKIDNEEDDVLTASIRGSVNFIKAGAGRLAVGGGQTYAGYTELAGGTLATATNVAVEAVEGCVVHLDASRLDTMVLDSSNHVSSWRSTAGDGLVFRQPNSSQPTPVYVSDGAGAGLPTVRFGFTDATGTTKASTFLTAGQTVKHKTVIFVTMPTTGDSSSYYTPYGDINSADNRICFKAYYLTSTGAFYGMVGKNWGELGGETGTTDGRTWQYVNGECLMTMQSEYKAYFRFDVNGVSRHHVLTVVQAEGKNDILVVPSVGRAGGVDFYGSLCEVLVFDRTLSDAERSRIETALIRKWQLTHKGDATFENPLSPNSKTLRISGDARLEPGDSPLNVVTSVVVDAGNALVPPRLTYAGIFSAEGVSLAFENVGEDVAGGFFGATLLTGRFRPGSGLFASQRVAYRANEARIANGGFIISFR